MREMLLGIALMLLAGLVLVLRGAWEWGIDLLVVGLTMAVMTLATRTPPRQHRRRR